MLATRHSHHGFSLVELSIVLVILGLLTGGILAGQSLIRAAELRSVSAQYQRYMSATNAFYDRYFQLPGDFNNAQAFWGVANATPATCITTASSDSKTCNGDNNGQIGVSTGANEIFRFWQHLANAGLIEGQYDGISHGSPPTTYLVGSTTANSPSGKISSSLWEVQWFGVQSGNTVWFDGDYGNGLQFGGIYTNYDPATPIFKPEEAWNIDTKLDDGKPATGQLVARAQNGFNTCTDASAASTLTASYLLSSSSLACGLIFRHFPQ